MTCFSRFYFSLLLLANLNSIRDLSADPILTLKSMGLRPLLTPALPTPVCRRHRCTAQMLSEIITYMGTQLGIRDRRRNLVEPICHVSVTNPGIVAGQHVSWREQREIARPPWEVISSILPCLSIVVEPHPANRENAAVLVSKLLLRE
jgi:hypothetical protein